MLRVSRYSYEFKQNWNEFVAQSRNGTFLFQREFMDYHSERFSDHSVIVWDHDKIVSLLPANQKGSSITSHAGLTYGGLVVNNEARLQDVIACFYSILKYFKTNGVEDLVYKQIPYYYHSQHTFEDEYVMFLLHADLQRRDTSFLLEFGDEIKLQKGKKSNISKAKKENVQVVASADYAGFWTAVLEPNLMKSHNAKPVHSVDEILLLAARFPDNIKLYCAIHNNKIVAGTVLFLSKKTVNVQYISANEDGKNIGALDYLFAQLLEEYKSYKYFNFGIANENEGVFLNTGLMQWKEGFGARACSHNFYKIDTGKYNLLEKYA